MAISTATLGVSDACKHFQRNLLDVYRERLKIEQLRSEADPEHSNLREEEYILRLRYENMYKDEIRMVVLRDYLSKIARDVSNGDKVRGTRLPYTIMSCSETPVQFQTIDGFDFEVRSGFYTYERIPLRPSKCRMSNMGLWVRRDGEFNDEWIPATSFLPKSYVKIDGRDDLVLPCIDPEELLQEQLHAEGQSDPCPGCGDLRGPCKDQACVRPDPDDEGGES